MKRVNALLALLCGIFVCSPLFAADLIRIDPEKTAEPISPFIYGQFIEHLGRSIYGGVWAEMLEDRKFCFAVTDDYKPLGTTEDRNWKSGPYQFLAASPWKVVGPAGTVSMDTDHAYVGEHSVAVHAGGDGKAAGISQDGLALASGKQYTGHIVLSGDAGAAPIIVELVQDDGSILAATIDKLTADFQTYPLAFAGAVASDNARLEIISRGNGTFRIGTVSLMPADNIDGFRPDTVALLKELNSPVYRWPGGNFVSGYNWHDGVGDRDKRPPRQNPAWKGVEANDVGIHEFMDLMSMIKSQPYISLNTGLGTVPQISEEVEYFNGSTDTPMGKLRAANGHPAPFNIRFWAVGNEMFGKWQLGWMPEDQYVVKHNAAADAIWKESPSAQLVAVGDVGPWDSMMLDKCADHMNLLSEHIYVKDKPDVVAHVAQLADEIKRVATAFRHDRETIGAMKGKNIRIVMDEWNYWYGPYIYGELGVQYHLKDALGVARGLHEYFRNSDVFYMANYAQTVNVIGAIKTSRTAATLDTTGEILVMYRAHFGVIPIPIAQEPTDLDVSAAWTEDRKAITVAIVNPTTTANTVALSAGGITFQHAAKEWIVSGADAESKNIPGQPAQVTIEENDAQISDNNLPSPPLSAVIYRLELP